MTTSTKNATKVVTLRWDRSQDKKTNVWQDGLTINGKRHLKKGSEKFAQVKGNHWHSLRSESVVKRDFILEIVDNSLDAGATRIEITNKKGRGGVIKVKDNGSGMSLSDAEKLVSLGDTNKTSGSGQYGVGLKASFAVLGKLLEIESELGKGTEVTIKNLESCGKNPVLSTMLREIGAHLKPAIDRGVVITYNGQVVKSPDLEFSRVIDDRRIRSVEGWLFEIKVGTAANKEVAGWYVYKEGRAVGDYVGKNKAHNESDGTLVVINLISGKTERDRVNHWRLNATSKSKFADRSVFINLRNFVNNTLADDAANVAREKLNKEQEKASAHYSSIIAAAMRKEPGSAEAGDSVIDPDGTDHISPNKSGGLKVIMTKRRGKRKNSKKRKARGGGKDSEQYSPSPNGSPSSATKVGSRRDAIFNFTPLHGLQHVVKNQGTTILVTLDEPQVFQDGKLNNCAFESLAALAIVLNEDDQGERFSNLSLNLDVTLNKRVRRIVDMLAGRL